MNELSLYGVKIMYTYLVDNKKRFYEEMIVSVKASSFDEAYSKADKYAQQNCDEHLNPNGETVKTLGYELLDCFLAFDAENDICEIYSMYTNNKSQLTDDEFYEAITTQCAPDELYDLRYKEFNS